MTETEATKAFSCLKGLIFDCDGVLLDSRGANISFYNCIRDYLGLRPLTHEQEEYVHMATFEQALRYMIPKENLCQIPALLKRVESSLDYYSLLSLEDGLIDILDWLQTGNVKLALCTNRIDPLEGLLSRFNLAGYFRPIQTASNSTPKPDPDGLFQVLDKWGLDKSEVAFIGDSMVDQEAARAAGVSFWSFKNEKLEADLRIPGFSVLHDWMMNFTEHRHQNGSWR